jgi:hypothetical protein
MKRIAIHSISKTFSKCLRVSELQAVTTEEIYTGNFCAMDVVQKLNPRLYFLCIQLVTTSFFGSCISVHIFQIICILLHLIDNTSKGTFEEPQEVIK